MDWIVHHFPLIAGRCCTFQSVNRKYLGIHSCHNIALFSKVSIYKKFKISTKIQFGLIQINSHMKKLKA